MSVYETGVIVMGINNITIVEYIRGNLQQWTKILQETLEVTRGALKVEYCYGYIPKNGCNDGEIALVISRDQHRHVIVKGTD